MFMRKLSTLAGVFCLAGAICCAAADNEIEKPAETVKPEKPAEKEEGNGLVVGDGTNVTMRIKMENGKETIEVTKDGETTITERQTGGAIDLGRGIIVDAGGKIDTTAILDGIQTNFIQQQKGFMDKWDTNKDGKIDAEERKAIQRSRREDQFNKLDTDKNGVLSKEEFLAGRDLGLTRLMPFANMWQGRKRTKTEDIGTIERFDENGDGVVDDNEKRRAATGILDRMEQKGLTGRWKEFDANGDGILKDAEREAILKDIMSRLGKKTGDATE